ncbi:MAG: holo-ACP synthase [Syntrophobacterales bacterium]|nr:holo-ACP synthase [Syntrophobacterales bacterium]
MAIRGIGVDIVHIPRIEMALSKWGDRFRRRIFTERELFAARSRSKEGLFLALRFAAKEAFAKAVGTGIRDPLKWRDIEVVSNELGRPEIVLSNRLETWCKAMNIHRWYLSLSDDRDYAIAFVVLEGD